MTIPIRSDHAGPDKTFGAHERIPGLYERIVAVVPRIGETIQLEEDGRTYTVIWVNHTLAERMPPRIHVRVK